MEKIEDFCNCEHARALFEALREAYVKLGGAYSNDERANKNVEAVNNIIMDALRAHYDARNACRREELGL